MPPSSWERRHPDQSESWSFDFLTADGTLGGFVRLSFHPGHGVGWYWAALVGEGRPYLLVRDLEVPLPRLAASREVRSEALWADLNCETPFEHWSFAMEAFGVAMDDPDEALAGERGDRLGLGLDLEWEAVGEIVGDASAYDQPGIVHGEILVGGTDVEAITFGGHGWRRVARVPTSSFSARRSWLGGWLADGSPHRCEPIADDVHIEPLQRAPLLLETGGRRATAERWLCRFQLSSGPLGLGWAEWLTPRQGA